MAEEQKTLEVKLEGRALIEALKKQMEYYFSNTNLRSDSYLVSQMNSELYVPVKVIAGFNMVRNLTDDLDVIVTAMKECDSIGLNPDQTMVRPNIKSQRSTLILREIPSSVDPSEIKTLFGEEFGKVDLKSDIGDCWYVYFENDDLTTTAWEQVTKKTFRDQLVKARVKTENTLKTLQAIASSNKIMDPKAGVSSTQPNYYNFGMYPQYSYPTDSFDVNQTNYRQPRQPGPRGHKQHYQAQPNQPRNMTGYRKKKEFSGPNQNSQPQQFQGSERGRGGRGGSMRGRNNMQNYTNNRKKRTNAPPPNIGEEEFPPLTGLKSSTGEIRSYSRQEILDLFSKLKENVEKPTTLPQNCEAILVTPNLDMESSKPFPSTATKK